MGVAGQRRCVCVCGEMKQAFSFLFPSCARWWLLSVPGYGARKSKRPSHTTWIPNPGSSSISLAVLPPLVGVNDRTIEHPAFELCAGRGRAFDRG